MPPNAGSTPAASIASRPRRGCTVISAYFPDEAECTQASFPATRNPVSSKCATGAAISAWRTASRQARSAAATRLTMPVTAPGDTGTPNSSPIASQVRLPGQELPVPQVHSRRRDPRPVLHRRAHPGRGLPRGDHPARTTAGQDPVLGDPRPDDFWQVHDLTPFRPGHQGAGQAFPAARALARLVPDHRVRVIGRFQCRPRLPLRPPRPATGLFPQRLRRRLGQPLRRRRPGRVPRVLAQPGAQVRDLRRKRLHLSPQRIQLRLDATSAAPRSQCPWPRSPRAAGHWPRAKRPPHPGQDRHRAQAIDDHQRQKVINTPRRARLAKITHRLLRLTLPQYLSSYHGSTHTLGGYGNHPRGVVQQRTTTRPFRQHPIALPIDD